MWTPPYKPGIIKPKYDPKGDASVKTLIVVDMQKDFVTGALGSREAVAIVPKVKAKIDGYLAAGDEVIFTRDTHGEDYMETNEGRHLPVPHCIRGSDGWQVLPELDVPECEHIDKPNFGWPHWTHRADGSPRSLEEVELVGVCTDICVVSNGLILKALFPEIKISVDPSCCAGVTPEAHEAALKTMQSCQIELL